MKITDTLRKLNADVEILVELDVKIDSEIEHLHAMQLIVGNNGSKGNYSLNTGMSFLLML